MFDVNERGNERDRLEHRLDGASKRILEIERHTWTDETTTLMVIAESACCYVLAVQMCGVDSAEASRAFSLLDRATDFRW